MKKMFLLITALASFSAFAAPQANPNAQLGTSIQLLEKELNLSAAQKEQIQFMRQKATALLQADFQQINVNRAQIEQILQNDQVDEQQLTQLIQEQKELIGDALAHRIQLQRSILSVLTAEQREQAKAQVQMKKKEPVVQVQNDYLGW